MSAASPFITVVMPVRNEARFIAGTLGQLRIQDYPKDRFEILVADGMSDDGTRDIVARIAEEDERVHLLDNPKRRSSSGRNVGFMAGRGDLFVVVDGHCYVPDDTYLRNIAACFEKSEAHCLGRPQPLDPPGLTPFQKSVALARASRLGHGGGSLIYGDYEGYASPVSNGAAYRREVFETIGYVDEEFDACEDVEFNHRVERAGFKAYTSPKLTVRYYPRENLSALIGQMRRYGRGRTRLYRKHPALVSLSALVPACFAGGAAALVALLGLDLAFGLSAFLTFIFRFLGLALLVYVALVGLATVRICREHGWSHALRLLLVFLAVHWGLGLGMWEELVVRGTQGNFQQKMTIASFVNTLKLFIKHILCFIVGQRIFIRFFERKNKGKIVILMYHRINSVHDYMGLSIDSDFFEKQLKYIAKNYTLISLTEAVACLESGAIHDNYVVLTFDDGFKDNFSQAYPLLKKYNSPATVFVACDAIEKGFSDWNVMDQAILLWPNEVLDLSVIGLGRIPCATADEKRAALKHLRRQLKQTDHGIRKNVIDFLAASIQDPCERIMMTWDEVSKLAACGLVTIGAHTVTHPILSNLSLEDARFEIVESKRIIHSRTGLPVDFFAYPNGRMIDFNEQTVSLVQNAGFKAACTTVPGVNRIGSDPFRLKRIDVTYGICMGMFGFFSSNIFGAYISGEYKFFTGRG